MPLNVLDLPDHVERAPVDVYGVLSQPEHLALAHPAPGADVDHGLVPLKESRSNGEHVAGCPGDDDVRLRLGRRTVRAPHGLRDSKVSSTAAERTDWTSAKMFRA